MFQRTFADHFSESERSLYASSFSLDIALAKIELLRQMALGEPEADAQALPEFANE